MASTDHYIASSLTLSTEKHPEKGFLSKSKNTDVLRMREENEHVSCLLDMTYTFI